jgi:segregation and condensation protein A
MSELQDQDQAGAQASIPTPQAVPHAAKLRGELMTELPSDLYIPPDALEVFFETFEGPLDLLLYLIRKANVDILDIPMAKLTQQYLVYVEAMRTKNLELAADYLVMAAILIEIKSRMLLPRPKAVAGDDDLDPRAELVRRLLEYEQMKQAAQLIDSLPQLGRDFYSVEVWIEQTLTQRLPQVNAADLENAWRVLLRQARVRTHHKVTRDELSVREHMTQIMRRLVPGTFVEFADLFDVTRGVPVLVVNFLAVLELARETLIEVAQAEPYAPIYVKLRQQAILAD